MVQGLKGDKGDKGDTGATGPPGPSNMVSIIMEPCEDGWNPDGKQTRFGIFLGGFVDLIPGTTFYVTWEQNAQPGVSKNQFQCVLPEIFHDIDTIVISCGQPIGVDVGPSSDAILSVVIFTPNAIVDIDDGVSDSNDNWQDSKFRSIRYR